MLKRKLITAIILLVLLCLSGSFSLSIPNTSVDISFQSMLVLLPAFFLPLNWSVGTLILYFLLGAVGVPVFSNGSSGLDVLLGSHMGFFMGFALANYGLAQFNASEQASFGIIALYLVIGQLFLLIFGFGYLAYIQSDASIVKQSIYFLPGLVFKSLVGTIIIFFSKKWWKL